MMTPAPWGAAGELGFGFGKADTSQTYRLDEPSLGSVRCLGKSECTPVHGSRCLFGQ